MLEKEDVLNFKLAAYVAAVIVCGGNFNENFFLFSFDCMTCIFRQQSLLTFEVKNTV